MLGRVNPLAKVAVVLPATMFLLFTRDPVTPALVVAAAAVALVVGGGIRPIRLVVGAAIAMVVLAWFALLFGSLASDEVSAGTPVVLDLGWYQLRAGAAESGAATALRIGGVAVLALFGGAATAGEDLVRATVQQLRLPYRIGYGGLAALRFVPRFRREFQLIRAAHAARGTVGGAGPIAALRRGLRMAVPLLAGGIRHGERVSLAMDARAFGAHAYRTERRRFSFRWPDWCFLLGCWLVVVALVVLSAYGGWLRIAFVPGA